MFPIPHVTPPLWPEGKVVPSRRGRFAHTIVCNSTEMIEDGDLQAEVKKCQIGLIGLADDLGVEMNRGRIGAAQGPNAFRAALARYGVAEPHDWEWPRVFDAGNVIPAAATKNGDDEAGGGGDASANAAALEETHNRVTEATLAILRLGLFPVAIGGGHDLTFPFVRGVCEYWKERNEPVTSGVYFDAHLDVREMMGSGMPFRRIVEMCGVKELAVYGLDEFSNSREHVEWFEEHGGRVMGDDEPPPRCGFISVDLDVLGSGYAPGVSALNPVGWTPGMLEKRMVAAAHSPELRCLDIMELNPAYDQDGRTARVAARLFLSFLRVVAERRR